MGDVALETALGESGGHVAIGKNGVAGIGRAGADGCQVPGMTLAAPGVDTAGGVEIIGVKVTIVISIIGDGVVC